MSLTDFTYYERVMGTLVLVLAFALALVRGWPTWENRESAPLFSDRPSIRIEMREIQPTSQSQKKTPRPPAPLPPVVVPNDVLIKEPLTFGEGSIQVETPGDDEMLQDGAEHATATRQPDTEARLLKNVQPDYPSPARQDRVRARIRVEVYISETGAVQSATITERWRLYDDGSARPVQELGYGLEEAALTAAQRSLFRPAQARGRPVATRTSLTFTFGAEQ